MKSKHKCLVIILIMNMFIIFELVENSPETSIIEKKNGVISQNPQISSFNSNGRLLWNETWGGSGFEAGSSVTIDNSGNIYITGRTNSYGAGGFDVILMKYDSNGRLLWNETWGDFDYEVGSSIATDSSGNVFITGTTRREDNSDILMSDIFIYNIFLLKYDSDGNLLWNETWGEPDYDCKGYGIATDDSGNVYITGETRNDVCLLKYNSDGNLLWEETWHGISYSRGNGIVTDGAGNVYITGLTLTHSGALAYNSEIDVLLLKYDSDGNLLWNKNWGGSNAEWGNGITTDGSGNVYITGFTLIPIGGIEDDVILLKYDSSGNLLWNETWGSDFMTNEWGFGVAADGSGNVYVTGYTQDCHHGCDDVFLLKYDSNGKILWEEEWGSSGDDRSAGVATDGSGNVYITGFTSNFGARKNDIFLLKYKPNFGLNEYGENILPQLSIPGYDLYLLQCAIGLSIFLLYFTKKRSINSSKSFVGK